MVQLPASANEVAASESTVAAAMTRPLTIGGECFCAINIIFTRNTRGLLKPMQRNNGVVAIASPFPDEWPPGLSAMTGGGAGRR